MSESRSGESRGYSYGYSSESRCSSESRSYTPFSSWSSESHESSESRVTQTPRSVRGFVSSESREASESCAPIIRSSQPKQTTSKPTIDRTLDDSSIPAKYSNFEDIDSLIEQLEITIPVLEQLQGRGEKYSKSLKRRKQQIEKLRQIREDRIISEIEKESDEFEEKINEVKKLTLTPKKKVSPSYSSWGYDSSESHDGESRW